MIQRQLAALISVELRRSAPLVARMAAMVVVVLLILSLTGHAGAENASAILIGSSIGYLVLVPTGVSRDKLDGALDFLCSLPTSPRTLVIARFAAVCAVVLPGAIQTSAAYALYAPAWASYNRTAGAIALFLISWLLLSALGWLLVGLLLRFKLQTLVGAPMLAFGLVIVVISIFGDRMMPAGSAVMHWVRGHTWLPLALWTAVLLVFVIIAGIAGGLALSGVRDFRPRPDEIAF